MARARRGPGAPRRPARRTPGPAGVDRAEVRERPLLDAVEDDAERGGDEGRPDRRELRARRAVAVAGAGAVAGGRGRGEVPEEALDGPEDGVGDDERGRRAAAERGRELGRVEGPRPRDGERRGPPRGRAEGHLRVELVVGVGQPRAAVEARDDVARPEPRGPRGRPAVDGRGDERRLGDDVEPRRGERRAREARRLARGDLDAPEPGRPRVARRGAVVPRVGEEQRRDGARAAAEDRERRLVAAAEAEPAPQLRGDARDVVALEEAQRRVAAAAQAAGRRVEGAAGEARGERRRENVDDGAAAVEEVVRVQYDAPGRVGARAPEAAPELEAALVRRLEVDALVAPQRAEVEGRRPELAEVVGDARRGGQLGEEDEVKLLDDAPHLWTAG